MSVEDEDVADKVTFDGSFMSREIDTDTVGKVGLLHTADSTEGATVTRLQRAINSFASVIGMTTSAVHDFVFTWAALGVGTTADTIKAKIDAIVVKLRGTVANGGHSHTGVDGNGAKVELSNLAVATYAAGRVFFLSAGGVVAQAVGFFWDITNSRLGLGTETPNTTLDILGNHAVRWADIATAAAINAMATTSSGIRFTGSTATALNGLASGANGKRVLLLNTSSVTVTINHQNGGASAGNQITTPNGVAFLLTANASVQLAYDDTSSKWMFADAIGNASPLTTKADLYTRNGSADTRLGVGTNGQVLTAASGEATGLQWQTPAVAGNLTVATETTTATIGSGDDVVLADSSGGAYTLTLPAIAGGDIGKVLRIKKTTNDFNAITIGGDGADTVGGSASTTINTIGESLELIVSTATTWEITNRKTETDYIAYTPTSNGLGTISNVSCFWARRGQSVHVIGKLTPGITTASEARIGLPGAITAHATPIASIRTIGKLNQNNTNASVEFFEILSETSTPYITVGKRDAGSAPLTKQNASSIFASSVDLTFHFEVPLTSWNA